jgi:hypothetical protein
MQDQACTFSPELRAAMTWQKVSDWLKEHGGTIATIIIIFGALFTGVRYIVSSEVADIRSDVATLKGTTTTTDNKLDATNRRIDDLLKEALERAFPKPTPTATKAELKEDFKRANDLVRLARSENIKLDSQLIATYGREVAAIRNQPSAWQTLINLLNYRSFLNTGSVPNGPPVEQKEWHTHYEVLAGIRPDTIDFTIGNADAPNLPVLERIGQNLNAGLQHGPAFIVSENLDVDLDTMHIENAVFYNARIIYQGGPVILKNVYFVNCTFVLAQYQSSQLLADAVLGSSAVTFTAS